MEDPNWEKFFNEISVSFPKGLGFSYYQDCIYYQSGNKKYKCPIDTDPETAIPKIIEFFQRHGNIYSSDEPQTTKSSNKENITAQRKWRSFTADEKNFAISKYVDNKTDEYDLTDEEASDLLYVLRNSIEMGEIKSSRIVLKGNLIVDVTGIIFDEEDRVFEYRLVTKKSQKNPTRNKTDPLIKSWTAALQKLEKYSAKSEKKKKK